jgi:hypothetical protein
MGAKHKLRVFENRLLTRIFGQRGDKSDARLKETA